MSTVEDPQTIASDPVVAPVADGAEARCPFPHGDAAESCPVPGVGAARPRRTVERSKADLWVWKVLRIKE